MTLNHQRRRRVIVKPRAEALGKKGPMIGFRTTLNPQRRRRVIVKPRAEALGKARDTRQAP